MIAFLGVLYWLSLVIWVGGMVVFSFLLTPAIFQNFPKEQAGDIVGVLFPRYFWLGHIASVLALGSYFALRHFSEEGIWGDKARIALLLLMLAGAGINGLLIGPKSHDIKVQVRQASSEEAAAPLRKRFGMLHGISMLVNLIVILSGLALVVISALHPIRI